MDYAKQQDTDAFSFASKQNVLKTTEAIGDSLVI